MKPPENEKERRQSVRDLRGEDSSAAPLPGGSETILLAEDDAILRKLAKTVLEEFGYKIMEAENGEDAIRVFKENERVIHLLILDMIMPGKNGREVYEEVRKIKPGVKVLFTSGYTAESIHRKGMLGEGMDFIVKPVSPRNLLKKVRTILDRK